MNIRFILELNSILSSNLDRIGLHHRFILLLQRLLVPKRNLERYFLFNFFILFELFYFSILYLKAGEMWQSFNGLKGNAEKTIPTSPLGKRYTLLYKILNH